MAAAVTGDGFVTYDQLEGPDFDPARWTPVRLPLPTGGDHLPLDPNAEVTVDHGEVQVRIPRFSLAHDTSQAADSAKYLIGSTGRFTLPPDRPASFAADLAVANHGGRPDDYRRAMAAFQVFDLEQTTRVVSVCGTATRVLALDEQLSPWGPDQPYIYMAESPYADFDDDFTRFRTCQITLDRTDSTAVWQVDGQRVYQTHGTVIPDLVRIGFGIWTMLPIRDGHSRSLEGQGMTARWRHLRIRGIDM
jgi:hypothetical protein